MSGTQIFRCPAALSLGGQLLESAPRAKATIRMSPISSDSDADPDAGSPDAPSAAQVIPFRMRQCLRALHHGGVIACATEAVWGLSCDPWSVEAIAQLLLLKQRPADKGLILVAGDESQLEFLLRDLSPGLRNKLSVSWPGANTWLVPHHNRVPALVHGRFDSVAVRVSGHPQVRLLCKAYGGPLVSSSANHAGAPAPKTLFEVRRYFGDQLDAILPGKVGSAGRPSTIRDVFTDKVFRA